MKTYNDFINEGLFFNKWYKLQKLVIKDLAVNIYFISTFSASITALYPFFNSIVKNTELYKLTDSDIVLLTICALSVLLKESKENINKMMVVIKEKNLSEILNKFVDTLKNIGKLFSNIAEQFGKTIKNLMDLFAYSALLVPFIVGLIDIINLYNIDFKTFDNIMTTPTGALISSGIGVLTISLKHLISFIIRKINRSLKSKKTPALNTTSVVQSFENVQKIYENYFNI